MQSPKNLDKVKMPYVVYKETEPSTAAPQKRPTSTARRRYSACMSTVYLQSNLLGAARQFENRSKGSHAEFKAEKREEGKAWRNETAFPSKN
jgi:hypothetical protein